MGKRIVCSTNFVACIAIAVASALFLGGIATTIAQNNGPQVSVSTNYAVANQRIMLSATGFTASAEIGEVAAGETQVSGITLAGEAIPWDRINGGNTVSVDSDGEWSTAVDLPLNATTTASGSKTIEATDSEGVFDSVSFHIRDRAVEIDPPAGRAGTFAMIIGEGLPASNAAGSSFAMTLSYDAGSGEGITMPVEPHSNGELRAQFRIPTTGTIPSTNTGKISFQDDDGVVVEETFTHEVLLPLIRVRPTSGPPGTTVVFAGEGFRANVRIQEVTIGRSRLIAGQEIYTDSEGKLSIERIIPDRELGSQTVEVTAGNVTVYAAFTVTTDPTPTPTPRPTWTPTPAPTSTPVPTPTVPLTDLDGTIRLSPASGLPGSIVTVHGEGFPPLRPLRAVLMGGVYATPDPRPSADKDGTVTFDVIIPSLDPGTYNFFVMSGRINATSHLFRVLGAPTPTPAPTPTGTPTSTPAPQLIGSQDPPHVFLGTARLDGAPVPEGTPINAYDGTKLVGATLAGQGGRFSIHTHRSDNAITFTVDDHTAGETWDVWQLGRITPAFNLNASSVTRHEDSPALVFQANPELVSVFAYDNTSKRWQFFDPRVTDASTLERFIPGRPYLFRVSGNVWLLLNGTEHYLSCSAGNCWNQIVW